MLVSEGDHRVNTWGRKKGLRLRGPHTHSGILADRTVSQIIGVLLNVSRCQSAGSVDRSAASESAMDFGRRQEGREGQMGTR